MDEPEADDKVVTLNDIKVAIDPNIEMYTDGLVLEFNEEMNSLVLSGNESDCC
ncbi:hypothetical protein ACFYKX_21530 [Cytobacillus sp. FJAT-54145]|uniref:Uncharacterized protein n=1 Tax=Cytobacillus spartinae TaxID=3299023 RepID=A0ABW6KG63_9BACI